jgi:hypothetical protein
LLKRQHNRVTLFIQLDGSSCLIQLCRQGTANAQIADKKYSGYHQPDVSLKHGSPQEWLAYQTRNTAWSYRY